MWAIIDEFCVNFLQITSQNGLFIEKQYKRIFEVKRAFLEGIFEHEISYSSCPYSQIDIFIVCLYNSSYHCMYVFAVITRSHPLIVDEWCMCLLFTTRLNVSTSSVTAVYLLRHLILTKLQSMGNFVHTAFKAYCGVLLGPVWSATCDIGINTINSLVNVVKFAMDDWFNS